MKQAAGLPGDAGGDDGEWVERARRGDHAAFRVLVERYQRRAFQLALRILRDEEQAADAVQDAFLKVYRSLDAFEGRSAFYTWLYRIVMNQCLDRRRRSARAREIAWDEQATPRALEAADSPLGAQTRDAVGSLEAHELGALIQRAMRRLPDDARRTLELREIDELSYEEIAQALGIPKGTVMSRLHYARKRLRELLRAEGLDPLGAGSGREGGV